MFLGKANNDSKEIEKGLMYHGKALRSINKRLADPILGINDGIVCSVVSFLAQDVSSKLYTCVQAGKSLSEQVASG